MPPALMLVLIIGLAVLVTMMVTSNQQAQEAALKAKEQDLVAKMSAKGKVVYAIKDIPEGSTIPVDSLEEKEIEQAKIPQDALTSASLAAGRVAKYGIQTGQIVSQHDLAPQGISLGFEARLKEGMRAVTFAVDSNSGVAGFVTPESHVDVISMVGAGSETKVAPILSDVEVIACGQMYQKAPGGTASVPASSVTVSLSPEDAAKLIKAITASKLYLTLRNDKDHTPVATVDVTSLFVKPPAAKGGGDAMAALPPPSALPPPPLPNAPDAGPMPMGGPGMAPMAPPPPPLHEIEIWSGSKKDVLSVPKS
ncbi:MAG: Flp pilus assembly protein CpaB [Candidatus Obscuribacter sp.]|nr:Flp pilus assembly protein CpaB [Candidatus Obscuribacter sp.]MBK9203660.1 Flp pilus assembly protein CpaB [Candidatus Obscuribacter sp.]MBK9621973.1 Flp pilus assembly protein CpaB [Candidatus Obscuribacter sp.]